MGFKKQDYTVVLGALGLLLVASTVSMVLGLSIEVEPIVDLATILMILSSLYFVYKGVDLVGGKIGRAMTIVGLGVGYYGIYILPHLYYHIEEPKFFGPLAAAPVENFLHASTTMAFFIIAWGFYILYKGGKV